jgi:hypothetical protein
MRFQVLICLATLATTLPAFGQELALPAIRPAACAGDDDRVQVLLLGSYHMSNPGMDRYNLEADDVLTDKRQAEIADVVDALARFRPTKVAVEAPWADSAAPARYAAFRRGSLELRRSEEEQIGFRLAARLEHDRIYPIDVRLAMNDEALGPVIGQHPAFQQRLQELDSLGAGVMATMAAWLAEGTIGEMLTKMNQPDHIEQAHLPYIAYFTPMVAGETYAGADMVADWYKRNLRIFANLTRIAEFGDRIVVVYGQGHVKLLQDAVAQHPDYCVQSPLPYLADAP